MKNFVDLILIGLLLCIIGIGCAGKDVMPEVPEHILELENLTVYSADTKLSATLSFKKDAIYGDTKEVLVGNIRDIAVDSLGRVFIADASRMVIYAFEPDGRFIAQLGREGRGPGEFSILYSLEVHGDRLYAYDPSQYRIHIFTLKDLAGEKTVNLAENRRSYPALAGTMPWISDVYVRNDQTYIAKFLLEDKSPALQNWQNYEVKGLFYLLNHTGSISGELFEFMSEIRTRVDFGLGAMDYNLKHFFGKTLIVVSSDDHIYLAKPDYFIIKQYSSNGAYRQSFFYPISKIPLTQESAVKAEVHVDDIKDMKNMDLPEFWPVMTDLKMDNQNRLWVATTVNDMNIYEWWVLEVTGELITRFEWPRSKPVKFVNDTHIYTLETDEETGLQQIVRYRIEIN